MWRTTQSVREAFGTVRIAANRFETWTRVGGSWADVSTCEGNSRQRRVRWQTRQLLLPIANDGNAVGSFVDCESLRHLIFFSFSLGLTSTDGRHWHEQRSFVVRHLRNVGYGKTEMEVQIHHELQELLELIDSAGGDPIWPGRKLLPPSILNILWIFTTGKRIKRDNPKLVKFLNMLEIRSKAFDVAGGILSQMPWLRFVAPGKTGYALIQELNAGFHAFFMEIIEEHLETYSEEKSNDDLIYAFIKEMKSQEDNQATTFTLNQLIMIILDIFLAGSTITSITIDLALMITMMRPDLQEKCQKEIHAVLGADGSPNYAERSKLPFVEAMLLEVQRYFHIVAISGPRRALKTCELDGFTIPKNTTILIGLRSVNMDVDFWKDPEVFRPERFLDENSEVKNIERFTPFGAGRRRCLGDQLARACMFTFYAGILQKYKLKPSAELASLDLLPGITLSPKPYSIVFEKR